MKQLAIRTASRRESLRLQERMSADLSPLYESGGLARNTYLKQLNSLQELKAEIASLEGREVVCWCCNIAS